jgi:hypothetical protein
MDDLQARLDAKSELVDQVSDPIVTAASFADTEQDRCCALCNDGVKKSYTIICKECHTLACPEHASIFDMDICANCLPEDAVRIDKEPLIYQDVKGEDHVANGTLMKPTGSYYTGTLCHMLVNMSNAELEAHITTLREKVRQIQLMGDKTRVELSCTEHEFEDRKIAERKRLRGVVIKTTATGNVISTNGFQKKIKTTVQATSTDQIAAALGGGDTSKTMELLRKVIEIKKAQEAAEKAAQLAKFKSAKSIT